MIITAISSDLDINDVTFKEFKQSNKESVVNIEIRKVLILTAGGHSLKGQLI